MGYDDAIFLDESVGRQPQVRVRPARRQHSLMRPSSQLHCVICTGVLDEPQSCVNSHVFCAACLARSLQNSSACPCCRVRIARPVPCPKLSRTLAGLRVRCEHAPSEAEASASRKRSREMARLDAAPVPAPGCGWTGVLRGVHAHEAECALQPVACTVRGCDVDVPRRDLAAHVASCPQRPLRCPHCNNVRRASQLERHIQGCPQRPVVCEHDACDWAGTLEQLAGHLADGCEEASVACAVPGCDYEGPRRAHAAHAASSALAHVALLVAELSAMRQRHDARLAQLRARVNELEEEVGFDEDENEADVWDDDDE